MSFFNTIFPLKSLRVLKLKFVGNAYFSDIKCIKIMKCIRKLVQLIILVDFVFSDECFFKKSEIAAKIGRSSVQDKAL